jgi:hypothetical protein
LGTSWAAAQAYLLDGARSDVWYDLSAVAESVVLGSGAIPQGVIFGTAPGQIGGFTLTAPLPKPSGGFPLAFGTAVLVTFNGLNLGPKS